MFGGEEMHYIKKRYAIVMCSVPPSKFTRAHPGHTFYVPSSWFDIMTSIHLLGRVLRGLRAGELGDSLGALEDGVLGQLTRKKQTNRVHDLPRSDGVTLVATSKIASLSGNAVEDIVDEGVHDLHGVLADEGIRVDRVKHLVDGGRVRRVVTLSLLSLTGLLLRGSLSLCSTRSLFLLLVNRSSSLRHCLN